MAVHEPRKMSNHFISAMIGMFSFLLFAVPGLMLIRFLDMPLLAGVITGGGGALVLSLFTLIHSSRRRMVLAGIAGMLAGMTGPFLAVMVLSLLLELSQNPDQYLWGDVLVMVTNGMSFGAVFAGILFGRRSILTCMVLCGIIALPFGLLTNLVNTSPAWKDQLSTIHEVLGQLDYSFLFGSLALGAGAGLCTAVYGRPAGQGTPSKKR